MSASATVQQIDDLYSRITEETNARFEEGANNLQEINATVIRELASIRQELQRTQVGIQEDIVRRIELVGLEIDRRIGEKGSVSGREKLLMSDPRNKNIESFNGHKAEDTKNFRHWRTKVFNYIERFAPGAKTILIKCVCDEEFDFDTEIAKVPQWDSRYTEEVMRHELKVFLTDHLGEKASEIIENEDEDGFGSLPDSPASTLKQEVSGTGPRPKSGRRRLTTFQGMAAGLELLDIAAAQTQSQVTKPQPHGGRRRLSARP